MEYVLGVGFACKIYKKNPSIRLFIDDILIDEFELDPSYDIKNFSSTKRIVESLIGEIDRNFPKSFIVPIKIKLYTLKPNIHFQQNSTVVFDINNLILLHSFRAFKIAANPEMKKYPTAILAASVFGRMASSSSFKTTSSLSITFLAFLVGIITIQC